MDIRLTKLQAVNRILRGASEAPLSSLDEAATNESLLAEQILDETDLQWQMQGLHENMGTRVLEPNEDGHILVPQNYITVEAWGCDITLDVKVVKVDLEYRLYNIRENTDEWEHKVEIRFIERIDFESLPAPVQFSIVDTASRIYQNHVQGDPMADAVLREVQLLSRAVGKAYDIRAKRKNNFQHGRSNGPRFGGRFVRRWWS